MRRPSVFLLGAALAVAACGGDDVAESSTTSSTAAPVVTTAPTTTAGPRPSGPAYIMYGERSEYVAALQYYLACAGFGPLEIDGIFGDGTKAAVEAAQAEEGKRQTGEPDESTFSYLARACDGTRTVFLPVGERTLRVVGNAAPGDEEDFSMTLDAGATVTVRVVEGAGIDIGVMGADGTVVYRPSGDVEAVVEIPTTQAYAIRVSVLETTTFVLDLEVPTATIPDEMALGLDGIGVASFGDDPDTVIAILIDLYGDPAADTDWVEGPIDEGYECAGTTRRVAWPVPGGDGGIDATLTLGFSDYRDGERAFRQWTLSADWEIVLSGAGIGALATAEGITVGSTFADVADALGEPGACGEELGDLCLSDDEGAVTYRFRVVSDDDHEDDDRLVAEIRAGSDGCEIPDP